MFILLNFTVEYSPWNHIDTWTVGFCSLDYRCNYRWRGRLASLCATVNLRTWPKPKNLDHPPLTTLSAV
jgi:hypothetical protein